MHAPRHPCIEPGEGHPALVSGDARDTRYLITGDHAGSAIPRRLGTLGLGPADLGRHIGSDLGVETLGCLLARKMGAVFVRQRYSRLVVDCNRHPSSREAVPDISDGTLIPGNIALSPEDRLQRVAEIAEPYQQAISAHLAVAAADVIFVALHSFTPMLQGRERHWHIGILHDGGDARVAKHLVEVLRKDHQLVVGDNEPYRMDETDYSVPRHCHDARIPYAEIEVRQDLLMADPDGWAERLAAALTAARALYVSSLSS